MSGFFFCPERREALQKVIFTEEQLRDKCPEWQKILRLQTCQQVQVRLELHRPVAKGYC